MTLNVKGLLVLMLGVGLFSSGCATGDGDKTWKGAGLGALGGALAGAGIAAATGKNIGQGALIGGAAGAAVGATTGVILDRQEEKLRKSGIAATRDADGRLLVTMSGDGLKFATGSDVIGESGKQQLYKISVILKEYPENRIAIHGHTDSVGKDESNLKLSRLRASSVEREFRTLGVPSKCFIQTEGYGESRPVADNTSSAGKAANRRVDLIISADEEEAEKNQKAREDYKNRAK